jgi:hypothetical protein
MVQITFPGPFALRIFAGGRLRMEHTKSRNGLRADDNVIWSVPLLASSSTTESCGADPNDPNNRASNFETPLLPRMER